MNPGEERGQKADTREQIGDISDYEGILNCGGDIFHWQMQINKDCDILSFHSHVFQNVWGKGNDKCLEKHGRIWLSSTSLMRPLKQFEAK